MRTGEPGDCGVSSFHEGTESSATLEFWTAAYGKDRTLWRLRMDVLHEFAWTGEPGELRWTGDHLLLAHYHDAHAWISYSKPFKDLRRVRRVMAKAHRRVTKGYDPVGGYPHRNIGRSLYRQSLKNSFGILLSGPERIMAAYESALQAAGEDVAMGIGTDIRDPDASLVTFGDSYFVAREFDLERLSSSSSEQF